MNKPRALAFRVPVTLIWRTEEAINEKSIRHESPL